MSILSILNSRRTPLNRVATFAVTLVIASAAALSAHAQSGYVYWTVDAGQFTGVRQAAPPCFVVENVANEGDGGRQIAIDSINENIYWANDVADQIRSADADGSNSANLGVTVLNPRGLDVDAAGDRLCWSEVHSGSETYISCSELDGANRRALVT